MKGQLDIFLHNVKTGADEHYHQTNMVTNAVKEFINMSLLQSNIYPIATTALGRLLLFDDTLTENVNNFMFPSEAHLVGYANRDTDTSHDFRGSINSLESGATSTGYKTTWDFTTSQLNKTIGSVALSNVNVDPIAHGLKTNTHYRAITGSSYRPVHIDSSGYLYTMQKTKDSYNSNAYITIYKSNSPVLNRITSVAVGFSPSSSSIGFTQIAQYTLPKSTVVISDLGNILSNSNQVGVHGDYLYLVWVASSTTLKYLKFKVSDGSFDMDESATTITVSDASFVTYDGYTCVIGDKIFVAGPGSSSVYIIDIDNTSDVTVATTPHNVYSYFTYDYSHTSSLNDCLIAKLINGSTYYHALIYPDGTVFADPTLTGSGPNSWANYDNYGSYKVDNHLCYLGYTGRNYWGTANTIYSYPVGQYLGTICNLSSPVTKTSAQTMKIVYTLTDA